MSSQVLLYYIKFYSIRTNDWHSIKRNLKECVLPEKSRLENLGDRDIPPKSELKSYIGSSYPLLPAHDLARTKFLLFFFLWVLVGSGDFHFGLNFMIYFSFNAGSNRFMG